MPDSCTVTFRYETEVVATEDPATCFGALHLFLDDDPISTIIVPLKGEENGER